MKIVNFIQRQLLNRLNQLGLLVVYDKTQKRLFETVVAGLKQLDERIEVVSATEDPIAILQAASTYVKSCGTANVKPTVIYIPKMAPGSAEAKVRDPFAWIAAIGKPFPELPMDEYLQLAKACFPNRMIDVERLFAESNQEPDFAILDQLDGNATQWPILSAKCHSSDEQQILRWMLTSEQDDELQSTLPEILTFASLRLGLDGLESLDIHTLQEKLWERVLWSEYVASFEAPEEAPSMAVVPNEAFELIHRTLEAIRMHKNDAAYIQRADLAEQALATTVLQSLPISSTPSWTFRFEERAALSKVVDALIGKNINLAQGLLSKDKGRCLWAHLDDSEQQWELVEQCLVMLEEANKIQAQVSQGSDLSSLIKAYATEYYRFDNSARIFTKTQEDFQNVVQSSSRDIYDITGKLDTLTQTVHDIYRNTSNLLHSCFIRTLTKDHWPARDVLNNADVFDKFIEPVLKIQDRKVAFIIVDALRYEVAQSLMQRLSRYSPTLQPACAAFPSITSVGKASLLPQGATMTVNVDFVNNTITPSVQGAFLNDLSSRMGILSQTYGKRFTEMTSETFLKRKFDQTNTKADLYVIRYDDIDKIFENGSGNSSLSFISQALTHLSKVIDRLEKLKVLGVTDVVIASDHGFIMNYAPKAGDKCDKPQGAWVGTHDRFLFSQTTEIPDANNEVVTPDVLGIKTNAQCVAFPKAMFPYVEGKRYYHGGVSLQEGIVPVITFKLANAQAKSGSKNDAVPINMTVKNAHSRTLSNRITIYAGSEENSLFEDETIRPVLIRIFRKGDRGMAPVGNILGNETGALSLVGNEKQTFLVHLNDFEEDNLEVVVRAVHPDNHATLAEVTFDVEVTK